MQVSAFTDNCSCIMEVSKESRYVYVILRYRGGGYIVFSYIDCNEFCLKLNKTIGGVTMSKKGYSRQGFFGDIHHYDEHGHKTGTSKPGLFGGYTNYDSHGNKTGHSDPGFFGGYNHYDSHGKKIGHSDPNLFGGYNHYDSDNKSTGSSDPSVFGGYNHSSSGGCYIATCVYGSYDCPEVWTLRRFRDNILAANIFGRIFIKTYYAISPTLVKWFGNTIWFKKLWKNRLDKMVSALKDKGVDDTPYEDK